MNEDMKPPVYIFCGMPALFCGLALNNIIMATCLFLQAGDLSQKTLDYQAKDLEAWRITGDELP